MNIYIHIALFISILINGILIFFIITKNITGILGFIAGACLPILIYIEIPITLFITSTTLFVLFFLFFVYPYAYIIAAVQVIVMLVLLAASLLTNKHVPKVMGIVVGIFIVNYILFSLPPLQM